MTYKKPPLGLKPRYIHDEQRRDEIMAATYRFLEAGKAIPPEWSIEYAELTERIQKRQE